VGLAALYQELMFEQVSASLGAILNEFDVPRDTAKPAAL
jgi:hypothetical protein